MRAVTFPLMTDMRATVMGMRNRLGPALPVASDRHNRRQLSKVVPSDFSAQRPAQRP
jgi:hypothetical protein